MKIERRKGGRTARQTQLFALIALQSAREGIYRWFIGRYDPTLLDDDHKES